MATVQQLSIGCGDTVLNFDTDTEAARQSLKATIDSRLKDGAAIFAKFGGEDYRVQSYNAHTNTFKVKKPTGRGTKEIPAKDLALTIVPPQAGG